MILYLIFVTLIIPLTMWGIGSFWKKNPPREINKTYGYRSKISMKNKETWNFAHAHCSRMMRKAGIMTTILSLLCIIILVMSNQDYMIASIYIVAIQTLILLVSFIPTERALKQNFDRDGNRKTVNRD